MYKLFILAAVVAVAAAAPSHLVESPLVYHTAPAAVAYQEPVLTKVGSVVKSIPTAVSHQSQSIVHSSAHVVEDLVAPGVKTSYVAAAPIVKTIHSAPLSYAAYAEPAPYYKSYAAGPLYKTYGAAPYVHGYGSPYGYDAHYSSW